MGSRVIVLPVLEELEELLCATFLKETHEWATDSLHLCAGNLRDLAVTEDEGAGDLLELEVARNIGVDEDLRELSGCDDELGHQVHGVVAVTAELSWGCLVGAELAVELDTVVNQSHGASDKDTCLSEVETGAVTTVVVIPVHVQDLLALDGQQARQDTLGETGAEDDDLRHAMNTMAAAQRHSARTSYSSSMVVRHKDVQRGSATGSGYGRCVSWWWWEVSMRRWSVPTSVAQRC